MSAKVRNSGSRSQQRIIKVAPVTRAVRTAMAFSAAALALFGTSNVAYAGACAKVGEQVACADSNNRLVEWNPPVVDLTAVAGELPASVTTNKQHDSFGSDGAHAATGMAALAEDDDIGIYIVSPSDVSFTNKIDVSVESDTGLADAIFVGAKNIKLTNSGDLTAKGHTWAAGIESQADAANSVTNSGVVDAVASGNAEGGPYGHAYGIYATSGAGDLTINNAQGGDISARGPYATGIHTYNGYGGSIKIDNAASVVATTKLAEPTGETDDYGGFATGIRAMTSVEGSAITLTNSGDITVEGSFLANGIDLQGVGTGNNVTATNSGDLRVTAGDKYSAAGISVTADGNGIATNAGNIQAAGKYAYGVQVLANGNATATNSGDIQLENTSIGLYDVARGLDASSANGNATATNTGKVTLLAGGYSTGISAEGLGSTASNSGDITLVPNDAGATAKYGVGVYSHSQTGRATASNSGSIQIAGLYGLGINAVTEAGDIRASNSGQIEIDGSLGYGVKTRAQKGAVSVTNAAAGEVNVTGDAAAFGLVGWSRSGTVNVRNDGAIATTGVTALDSQGNLTGANPSAGIFARADAGPAVVTNNGDIEANNAFLNAIGIQAQSSGSATVTNNASGTIFAETTGEIGDDGKVPFALGIYASSTGGNANVTNKGAIQANSTHGAADGIFAGQDRINVTNSGVIAVDGATWGAGIEAQGQAWNVVTNKGDVAVSALANDPDAGYGHAYGIYATSGKGGVRVTNAADATVSAIGPFSTGIHAYNGYGGGITISNAGTVSASDVTLDDELLQGYATGIRATSSVEGSKISIVNSGDVKSDAYWDASGIDVQALGTANSATVKNSGNITASSYYSFAKAIYATADGNLTVTNSGTLDLPEAGYGIKGSSLNGKVLVTNSGDISATGGSFGVNVEGANGSTVNNSGSVTVEKGKYNFGIQATSAAGDVAVTNTGSINTGASDADKYSFGIVARAAQHNARATNSADITNIGKYAYGAQVVADQGDASFTNTASGKIASTAASIGAGGMAVTLNKSAGNATLRNDGSIAVTGTGGEDESGPYGAAATFGLFGRSDGGASRITNNGDISASNAFGPATGIHSISAGTNSVTNGADGSIDVSTTGPGSDDNPPNALGIYASSTAGDVVVRNDGSIEASSKSGLADGIFVGQSKVNVRNTGSIAADGSTWAAGIEAQGTSSNSVINDGDITASALANDPEAGYGHAYGIYSTSGKGTHSVTTSKGSSISLVGVYGTGIHAYNGYGGAISVTNGGDLTVTDETADGTSLQGFATGIRAVTSVEGSKVTVANSGNMDVTGYWDAAGIDVQAIGTGNSASITNTGNITTSSYYTSSKAIYGTADGNLTVTNSGSIDIADGGYGVLGASANGKALVTNSGDISVAGGPFAVNIEGANGTTVNNSGDITIGDGKYAFAVQATSANGDVNVNNTGSITSGIDDGTDKYTFGVLARARQGDAFVTNSGTISTNGKYSYGAESVADLGDATITNTAGGKIDSSSNTIAMGAFSAALGGGGNATVTNAGDISVVGVVDADGSGAAGAVGGLARSDTGSANIDNSGSATVHNSYDSGIAVGFEARAPKGTATVSNTGTIDVTSENGKATGVLATADKVVFTNSGDITATTGTSDKENAVGVNLTGTSGVNFTNSGNIISKTSEGSGIGVWIKSGGSLRFRNTGTVEGEIITESGDNSITNAAGSTWTLDRQSTDFAGANNKVHNMAGSVIQLANARIGMGGSGAVFRNDGAIQVQGDSAIEMEQAREDARANIKNADKLANLSGYGDFGGTGPGRGSVPLVNDGTIDLSNAGQMANRLVIAGDLAGRGIIQVDADAVQRDDSVKVLGRVLPGTKQQVNMELRGLPGSVDGSQAKVFATVDGTADKAAFVGGDVVGAKAGNFVKLEVNVDQAEATQGQAYQANVQANGLNSTGQLAASVGAGVQNLLGSQIGTFRQRGGAVPASGGEQRATGYVRSFGGSNDVTGGLGQNFGADGSVGLRQSNSGTELGLATSAGMGWTVGMTMAKSDGRQNLTSGSYGMTRFDADSAGVFATWMSPQGFYVDTSAWSMRYAGRLDSAAGRQAVNGNANAMNVEAGYTFKLANGLNIEPQMQYTLTRVDGMRLQGPDAQFDSQASDWQRSRMGVMAWKPVFGQNGILWTPYASASVIHMSGDKSQYSINQNYLGTLDTLGTSTLFEAGLGMRKNGFSANAGLNLTQGDRTDSGLGGQFNVRYSW